MNRDTDGFRGYVIVNPVRFYILKLPYYPCFVTGLLPLFYLIDNVTFNINPVLLSQLARANLI